MEARILNLKNYNNQIYDIPWDINSSKIDG